MITRIVAIDNFRTILKKNIHRLLEKELEHDNELMAEFGVSPERTLMIGDTTHDLQLAANAGAASLGVSYGAHEPDSFAAHGPLAVLHSTRELQDWLVAHA